MKKVTALLIATAMAACTLSAAAEEVAGVDVSGLEIGVDGSRLTVDMNLALRNIKLAPNRAILLTPRLVNGDDSVSLTPVGIYGKRRYAYYVRDGHSLLSCNPEETIFKAGKRPESYDYSTETAYQDWMDGADLKMCVDEFGCCNTLVDTREGILGSYHPIHAFFPPLVFVAKPGEQAKSRQIEGAAYIDFVVDKTDIRPDYRRNTVELEKIRASIDSVRNDADITIDQVWLKGYASPESPYSHNRDLAKGRTQAISDYVQQLYRFPDGIITTDYEPEDWNGLRRFVESSNIDNREAILEIIDSDLEPDAREARIKQKYPSQYRFLLDHCYPALRHTDYRIAYTIRDFNDIEEIKRIFATTPGKLSLNELYLLSQEYEPGSPEFSDVFETAVRLYPDDEVSNLNAANAAMRRGDNENAARYLPKAGDSPEAIYARGALEILNGNIDEGLRWMQRASAMGVTDADFVIETLLPSKKSK